jgi:carbon-monoxide dehydrogenase large subunit
MVYSRQIGARVKRKEDPRLITGSGSYVDDFQPRRQAHMAVLRSSYAHARIKSIDTSAAKQAPGVIAVYTGADLLPLYGPMPWGGGEGGGGMQGQVTVVGYAVEPEKVRHVGQAVAVVVAEDQYAATDALDLIAVDYEPLDPIVDVEAAMQPGAPLLYDNVPNNICYHWKHKAGDPDAAFASADVVVNQRMTNSKIHSICMETRGILAEPERFGNGLTIYTSTQNPHTVRTAIAKTLRIPETDLRVIAPDVGGGFGAKANPYPEDIIAGAIALQLRRPIKFIETRSEHLATTTHGRAHVGDFSIAAKKDGTVVGLKMNLIADLGAYPRGSFIPMLAGWLFPGVYACPNIDMEIKAVYTTTMAVDAYRGAGRPEAAYYVERLMDLLADELNMDPAELRRKNFIPPDAFPYKTTSGLTYDSGEYAKPLAKALEIAGYEKLKAEQAQLRSQGRYLGIGISTFTEICGFGPYDSAAVRVEPTGKVTVMTGISPHGQGSETTFAQIVADQLGVTVDDVVVIHGDTARTPQGIGTMGSRSLVVGGSALWRSSTVIREKAIKIAAHLLEASPEDIELRDGSYSVKGAPGRGKTLADIAGAAYGGGVPDEIGTGLEAVDFFRPPDTTFPFGADVALVEVHPDTGKVDILRYVAVDDCGNVVSPLLVEGQVHGGLAQGIAQALWEEIVYDESGQLITGSLMDYAVPVAESLPSYETDRTVTTTPLNPLGAKGIGELATIGSAPTIVNAVMDALSPFGIRHLDMPLRPERVWRAIHGANGKNGKS